MASIQVPNQARPTTNLSLIECSICQGKGAELNKPISLPCEPIAHTFCLECIQPWITKGSGDTNACPMCKQPIFSNASQGLQGRVTDLSISAALRRFLRLEIVPLKCPIEIVEFTDDTEAGHPGSGEGNPQTTLCKKATAEDLEAFMKDVKVNAAAGDHTYTILDSRIAFFILGLSCTLSLSTSLLRCMPALQILPFKVLASSARLPLSLLLICPWAKVKMPPTAEERRLTHGLRLVSFLAFASLWGGIGPETLVKAAFLALIR